MFGNDRNQTRRMFTDVWQKMQAQTPLTALENIIADVIALHPEYHQMLTDPEILERDYLPDGGRENPFLHMGMHIAIREQISIDRPPGIRAAHQALSARLQDVHAGEHVMLECLGRTLWEAQRAGLPPDQQAYLACVQTHLRT